jgi:superoxide dismutase, Fe-Mn family
MAYAVAPLPFKPHRLVGLSERLIVSHYEANYGGALRRLHTIEERLAGIDWSRAAGFEINGLARERLIALNSVVLHEVYFEALGGSGEPAGLIAQAIARDFGSIESWRREFIALGKALAGGSGWVVLAWSERAGRLVNQWASDHAHAMAGAVPILALDMYEHAYALDFGAKAVDYVDAFMNNICWPRVEARLDRVVGARAAEAAEDPTRIAVAELQARLAGGEEIALIDVCLADDVPRRKDTIPGARFTMTDEIGDALGDIPRDRPVVVTCIYGFQVSGEAAAELRRLGYDARVLAGGMAAWHAMGGPTEPLDQRQRGALP